MNSPTIGSSAPPVARGITESGHGYELKEGVATGNYLFEVSDDDPLDARIKCTKCNLVTLRIGMVINSWNSDINITEDNEDIKSMRVYVCTVCGDFTSKR